MKNRQLHRLFYKVKHNFFTINTGVIVVAFLIAASWVWGSLGVMERNYTLQRELDRATQRLELAELESRNLELEGRFFRTEEYQELAARKYLGLAKPGEKVLVLPANSAAAREDSIASNAQDTSTRIEPSNLQQWIDFLFNTRR